MATVGINDGANITLTMNGANVTEIPAGAYEIRVRDRSVFHNFALRGPGVDRSTEVEFVGEETWLVTLTEGIYTFLCVPHASTMRGSFGVGRPLPPPPPPPPPARCKVPKVVGKKLPVARRLIARARCRVGRVRRARSARPRGRVLSQSPRAGLRRARGTRVNLLVSRGRS